MSLVINIKYGGTGLSIYIKNFPSRPSNPTNNPTHIFLNPDERWVFVVTTLLCPIHPFLYTPQLPFEHNPHRRPDWPQVFVVYPLHKTLVIDSLEFVAGVKSPNAWSSGTIIKYCGVWVCNSERCVRRLEKLTHKNDLANNVG